MAGGLGLGQPAPMAVDARDLHPCPRSTMACETGSASLPALLARSVVAAERVMAVRLTLPGVEVV